MLRNDLRENRSPGAILLNMLIAAVSLFVNGFGIYLTIQANIGAAPWDVLNLGLSKSLGILYGNASIAVSVTILIIDILLKEPIGIAMFIDAVVVGKAVDFFNWIHPVSPCQSLLTAIPVMIAGLFVLAYTQYTYMKASLGCGPRDTLMVGLAKRLRKLPIALVSIALLSTATLIGCRLSHCSVRCDRDPASAAERLDQRVPCKTHFIQIQIMKTNEEISDFDNFVQNRRSLLTFLIHRKSVSV